MIRANSQNQEKKKRLVEYVLANATKGDIDSVYATIDKFCYLKQENSMMNVGPEKAKTVEALLKQQPINSFLELGTFMGYSAFRFSKLIQPGAKYVTIDINEETTQMAKTMAEFGGAENIEFLLGGLEGQLEYLKKSYPKGFDTVFVDHWKDLYLSDLRVLEKAGLVREGTRVVADNLIKPGVPEYCEYMTGSEHYDFKKLDICKNYRNDEDCVGYSVCKKSF